MVVVGLMVCGSAFAQYGGGKGGTGATGGTSTGAYNRSYGNGAAIGAGIGAAAGAGALFLFLHHRHAPVVGCVASDGKSLTADNIKQTYQLAGEPVTAGEHISVVGKKSKGSTGLDELDVATVKKNLGHCQQQAAMFEPHL